MRPHPQPTYTFRGTALARLALAAAAVVGLATGCAAPGGTAIDGAPEWLPIYPGSEGELIYSQPGDGETTGAVSLVTNDDAGDVVTFYRERLEGQGFKIRLHPFRTDFGRGARIDGFSADETRGFHATVTPEDGTTTVFINYTYAG